ncbi:hypothetical protein M3Y94_01095900 [Aphelenchoides besseyi]|nr:hypothetical protein M3Y94_01095900 [Aphelenchoides besseyi]
MDTVEDWEQLRKSQRHLNIYRYKESIQFSRSRKTYRCSIDDCHHDYGRSPYLAADIINHFEARHPVVFQSSDPDDWTSVQTKVKRIAKHASFVEKSDSILRKRCRLCLYNYGKIDLTHQCSQIEAHMVHAHAEDWYPENKTETRDWIPVEELNKLETKRGPQSKYAQWLERHKETEILRCSLSKCHEEFGTSVRSAGHILQTHFRTVHPIEFAKLEEIDIWTSGSLEFSTHMREFKGYLQFNQSHTKFRCNVNRCFKQFGSYQTSKHAFEVHMQSKHSTEYEEMIERNKVLQVENRYIRHKETEIFKVGHLIKYNSNCAAHYCVVNNCNEKIEAKGTALCGVFHYHVKTIHPIEYEANRQYFDSIDKDTLYYGQQSIAKQMGELATWIYKRTRAYRYYTRTHRVFQSGKKVVKKPLIAVKLGRISYRSFGRSLSSHNVE